MSTVAHTPLSSRPGSMLEYQQRLLLLTGNGSLSSVQEAFVAVRLGRQRWLVDLSNVQEALAPPRMARIASAPRWVAGVVGVRGQVWSVIDMLALSPDEGESLGARSRGWMTLLREPQEGASQRIALLWSDMVEVATKHDYQQVWLDANGVETNDLALAANCPPWVRALWRDREGQVWNELDIDQIVGDRGLISTWRQRVDIPMGDAG